MLSRSRAGASYLTADHLGSPRINTDRNGNVTARHDYMPFGEDISTSQRTSGVGYAGDSVRNQFTSQERDEESGLDYLNARFYGSVAGRFTSADDFGGKVSNPQSLNLYAYAMNRPLKWVDPTGHSPDNPTDCVKDGVEQCTLDSNGNNKAVKPNGHDYWLPDETVVIHTGDASQQTGPSSQTENAPPPDLPDTWRDYIPVYGSLRRFAYNYNCNNGGGCNGGRAIGNFAMLAVDLSPIGEAGWSLKLAEQSFAREVIEESVTTTGGRLGNAETRAQVSEIADGLESRGYQITGGGGRMPEEYLGPQSGGRSGGSYVDITAEHPTRGTIRVNTVDTWKNGVTPTARETRNAVRIRNQIPPGQHLFLIPKRK